MEASKAVIYLWLGSLLEWIGADPATPAETIIIKKRYQPALQLKSLSLWYSFSPLNQNFIAFSRKRKQPFFFFFPKDNKYFFHFQKKQNKNNSSFPLFFPSYCSVCKKRNILSSLVSSNMESHSLTNIWPFLNELYAQNLKKETINKSPKLVIDCHTFLSEEYYL